MRQSFLILRLSGVGIDQKLKYNPCLGRVDEQPQHFQVDYSNSSRADKIEKPTDISYTYEIAMSRATHDKYLLKPKEIFEFNHLSTSKVSITK